MSPALKALFAVPGAMVGCLFSVIFCSLGSVGLFVFGIGLVFLIDRTSAYRFEDFVLIFFELPLYLILFVIGVLVFTVIGAALSYILIGAIVKRFQPKSASE